MRDTLIYPVYDTLLFFRETALSPLVFTDARAAVTPEIFDPAAVYGEASVRVATEALGAAAQVGSQAPLTLYGLVLQVVTLAALGVYCWMVYYFREQIAMAVKSVVSLKPEERPGVENKQLNDRFLVAAITFSLVVCAIFATRFFEIWAIPAAVAVVVLAILAVQFAMLKIAGKLTLTEPLTEAVIRTKRTYIAAGTMAAAPLALLYTGVNPIRDRAFAAGAGAVAMCVAGLFIARTIKLFREQKISFLVWFLYLCAVEIFPIALVALLVAKGGGDV